MYRNTKFDLSGEEWEVRFLPRVMHEGKRVAAGRVPSKKLILVSTADERGNPIPEEKLKEIFAKAIAPIAYEIESKKKEQQDGIQ